MKKHLLILTVCLFAVMAKGQDVDSNAYCNIEDLPDAGIYLPAPPDTNNQLFIDDFQQWLWGKSVRHTPRGQQASWESMYSVDRMCGIYSEALGFLVSKETTPAIYRLIVRGERAAAQAVRKAKRKYMRRRPFARMNEHVAGAFDNEENLRGNGSYPSGHTSLGWTTALMLAQMAPELQDTILRRGWEYGESRVIVGAHWQSDVDAARLAASACVARVQTIPEYRADLAAARAEFLLWHGSTPQNVGFPNGRRILPAPVDTACFRFQGDVAAHWLAKGERNTPRGEQAKTDAGSKVHHFLTQFSSCLNMQLDTTNAPHITAYLKYVRTALKNEASNLKNTAFRRRPYVQLDEPTLIPEEEESHVLTTSYPSSHSTFGWGLAMAMVELTPDSMNSVLRRGFEYGRSRVIAGYHWASDVQAARLVATYTLIRLQREPRFQTLLDSARAEYATLRGYTSIAPANDSDNITLRRDGNNITLTTNTGNGSQPISGILNLYAVDGRLISSQSISGNTPINFTMGSLPHGVYVATFTGRDNFCSLKTVF
ncbi:MAG: phosphatase PAP2 family protein [Bacteroidales bacterium]|nr:phosphatase PAP2 family protein [Bacteroidales bacterium]